jgi:hypothetical protein
MKAIEFVTTLADERHIDIPYGFQKDIHKNQSVRVLILVEDNATDEQAWEKLTQNEFLKGYPESDSIYDSE